MVHDTRAGRRRARCSAASRRAASTATTSRPTPCGRCGRAAGRATARRRRPRRCWCRRCATAMGPVAAAFCGHPSAGCRSSASPGTNGKTTTTHLLGAIVDAAGSADRGHRHAHRARARRPRRRSCRRSWRSPRGRAPRRGDGGVVARARRCAACAARGSRSPSSPTSPTTTSTSTATSRTYFEAKAALFDARPGRAAVVNVDDPLRRAPGRATPLVPTEGYSLADASDLEVGPRRCALPLAGAERVELPLGGRFNVANALAAATAAAVLGMDARRHRRRARGAPPVPGRFEAVDEGQPFTVLVDYAHTPDGAGERARRGPRGRRRGPGARRVRLRRRPGRLQAPRDGRGGGPAGRSGSPDVRQPERRGSPGHHRRRPVAAWRAPTGSPSSPTGAAAIALAARRGGAGRRRRDRRQGARDDADRGRRHLPFDDRDVARAALRARREAVGW